MKNTGNLSYTKGSYMKKNRKIPNNRKITKGRENVVQIISFFDKKKNKNIQKAIIHKRLINKN